MSKFHPLKVLKTKKETDDAVSVTFEIPAELQQDYHYKQGQYLTLELEMNGEKLRRAYSLCSSPLGNEAPTVTVKKVSGGKVSTFVNDQLKVGDVLNVMIPEGRFYTEMNASHQKQYFLFGGGSGITPLMSIIKTVIAAEPNSSLVLLYANRNKNSIIFKDELDALKDAYKNRLEIVYSLDSAGLFWSGLKGMLNAETIKKHVSKFSKSGVEKEYFVCGPGPMMETVKNALLNSGADKDKIHIEYFTAPATEKNPENTAEPIAAASNDSQLQIKGGADVSIILEGKRREIFVPIKKTVLAAAQDAGLDPPFSCESGICSTCMAKVTEGKVRMMENNILTEKEVAAGYVLTCQALCMTDKVTIEYYD